MVLGGLQVLKNVLSTEELEQTPQRVQDKLKKYLDNFFEIYFKDKAAAIRLREYELKADELQGQIQDYELKLQNYNQNVCELRTQLDAVCDDRDHLLKVNERQNSKLERLQQDLKTYQQQLKAAISAKCEALARVDEIESKEVALDSKERRMEQERDMMHMQIQNLSQDLNRNVSELQNIRRENTLNTMQLESRLTEKTEDLKISQVHCNQYKETIERLTQNIKELSDKMFGQSEESQKMMDFYKKELDAQSKLSKLYKSNFEETEEERNELQAVIADLERMLAEASDQYGELEITFKATQLQYEQNIEEKNKTIESLHEAYKEQLQTLEERNKNYENTDVTREQTVFYLKDEIVKSQRETTNDLKRQAEHAEKQTDDETILADKLRLELITVCEDLQSETQQIDELSRSLQGSFTPSKNDNPVVLANKKTIEFEDKYEDAKIEIESLHASLTKAKEHADKMSQSAETEFKNLHDVHMEYVTKAEAELKELRHSEMNLKNLISELEADLQDDWVCLLLSDNE